MENLFRELENNRPFLKMAFEGFAGDGKTFTATQVAIAPVKKSRPAYSNSIPPAVK